MPKWEMVQKETDLPTQTAEVSTKMKKVTEENQCDQLLRIP